MVYIDGFNLYYGMRDAKWRDCYWLNCQLLGTGLLNRHQNLAGVKYFTAPVRQPSANATSERAEDTRQKHDRQQQYLSALERQQHLDVFLGTYRSRDYRCPACGEKSHQPEEKQTDVAIASQFVADAFLDRFDTAILVTGDSDIIPAISVVKDHFPKRRVVVAFPPERRLDSVSRIADRTISVNRTILLRSQLPDEVTLPDGTVLKRPEKWTGER